MSTRLDESKREKRARLVLQRSAQAFVRRFEVSGVPANRAPARPARNVDPRPYLSPTLAFLAFDWETHDGKPAPEGKRTQENMRVHLAAFLEEQELDKRPIREVMQSGKPTLGD